MKRTLSLLLLLLLGGLPTQAAPTDESEQPALLKQLISTYEGITSVTANFVQETRFAGFSSSRKFGGVVSLVRPDRMRWDYRDNSSQQIYVNGRDITLYTPEAEQAIITRMAPDSDRQVPLRLLSDVTGIAQLYHVVTAEDDANSLILTPREEAAGAPKQVQLWLDPKRHLIVRVTMQLADGNSSNIVFNQLQTGQPIDDTRFVFTAPEGVYVVHPQEMMPPSE